MIKKSWFMVFAGKQFIALCTLRKWHYLHNCLDFPCLMPLRSSIKGKESSMETIDDDGALKKTFTNNSTAYHSMNSFSNYLHTERNKLCFLLCLFTAKWTSMMRLTIDPVHLFLYLLFRCWYQKIVTLTHIWCQARQKWSIYYLTYLTLLRRGIHSKTHLWNEKWIWILYWIIHSWSDEMFYWQLHLKPVAYFSDIWL